MKKSSVLLLAPVAAGLLLSGCTAAELEQFRSDMSKLSAPLSESGPSLPAGGVDEATAKAQRVQLGQMVQGRIGREKEEDEYRFAALKGQEFVVYLQAIGEQGHSTNLRMLNDMGNATILTLGSYSRSSRSLEQDNTGLKTIPESAEFLIRVNGDIGPYRFQIVPINPRPERVAAAVPLGQTAQGEAIDHPGDYDEFTFSGTRGQRIVVDLQNTSSEGASTNLRVLSPAGNASLAHTSSYSRSSPTLDSSATNVIQLPESGTYKIRIDGDVAPYRFRVRPATQQ